MHLSNMAICLMGLDRAGVSLFIWMQMTGSIIYSVLLQDMSSVILQETPTLSVALFWRDMDMVDINH